MQKYKLSIFPIFLSLISALLFGLATPLSKLLLEQVNPFFLAGLLYLGAAFGLFPFMLIKKDFLNIFSLNRTNSKRLFGAIVLGGVFGPVLLLFGLKYSSSSSVSLWLNLELIATAVLGVIFFKDYLCRVGWIGVIIALISALLLTRNEGSTGLISALLVTMACVCWGFDNHFTSLIDGISAVQSTFLKGICAGIINTLIGYFSTNAIPSMKFILPALFLGSLSYGVSIVLYIISAQKLGAIRSQIIFSSAPFWGLLFSIVLLSESISELQVISLILLAVSIILVSYDRHEHFHEHSEYEHTHFHKHDDLHHDHVHDTDIFYHDHIHKHNCKIHSHPHWPDIHHRHDHC